MSSYSRKRPANKGEITSPVVRIQQDQTTGRITHVVLDDVQRGLEATLRAFDNAALKLNSQQMARMAENVILALFRKRPHTESQLEQFEQFLTVMLDNSNHGEDANAHSDSQGRGEDLPALP